MTSEEFEKIKVTIPLVLLERLRKTRCMDRIDDLVTFLLQQYLEEIDETGLINEEWFILEAESYIGEFL